MSKQDNYRPLHFSQFPNFAKCLLLVSMIFLPIAGARADASGTFVYTVRWEGEAAVLEVDWTYVRATPSLSFGDPRVIWSGAGAPGGMSGSDGLFWNPEGDLVVGNWQSSNFLKFEPTQTDVVLEGPEASNFAFHSLLHPNMEDFLATQAFGQISCTSNNNPVGCFGVYDHTPLDTSTLCGAPPESGSGDILQPVTFIADENLNIFTVFSDGRDCNGCLEGSGIQFGGGGFASFDLAGTNSTFCDGAMTMTQLIAQEISAAHSISWDPFLSDADDPEDPHSDFIVFANSRLSHIRVDDPGTPGASAMVVSTVNMADEPSCASLIPDGMTEFDQGAVTGDGIALVGDEATGYLALVDYSQNDNGTILDPGDMVCLTAFLADGIDDIAPLTGLGQDPRLRSDYFPINAGLNDAWYNPDTSGQGFFIIALPDDDSESQAAGYRPLAINQSTGKIFLAWFTFDTQRPPGSVMANVGDPGHRWLTAFGPYSGGEATLKIEITKGGVLDSAEPATTQNFDGTVKLTFSGCNSGFVTYDIPSVGEQGVIPIERIALDNVSACEQLATTGASNPTSASSVADSVGSKPEANGFVINRGLNDAWFNALTLGQGFFMNVFPSLKKMFLAWFTYDTERPANGVNANLGDPGHRWITAFGDYADNQAVLDIEVTEGGVFNKASPAPTQYKDGTLTVNMSDCENGTISYDITSANVQGEIPIKRIALNNVPTCESLAAQAQQSVDKRGKDNLGSE